MFKYRVKTVIEKAEDNTEDYVECNSYRSADSTSFELIRELYVAINQVAFYWNMKL